MLATKPGIRRGLIASIQQDVNYSYARSLAQDTPSLRRSQAAFRGGTLAPFFRASESPMAMACLRLFTTPPLPPLPDRSVPLFSRRTALSTLLPAAFPYLRPLLRELERFRVDIIPPAAGLFYDWITFGLGGTRSQFRPPDLGRLLTQGCSRGFRKMRNGALSFRGHCSLLDVPARGAALLCFRHEISSS